MSWLLDIYRSPMAKKAVMAVTGLMLFGFVFGHMAGNLKLYQGPEAMNSYAEHLRVFGEPILAHGQFLWIARIGLLLAVALHIHAAISLTRLNRKARPVGYQKTTPQKSTYASRTMIWGGVIIVLFVIYHLLHLTTGDIHSDFEAGAVYQNVVAGFQNPLVAAFYILANIALGFHLYHGVWSLFQTLGWNGPRLNKFRKQFAVVFALVISLANISFPTAVLFGIVGGEEDLRDGGPVQEAQIEETTEADGDHAGASSNGG